MGEVPGLFRLKADQGENSHLQPFKYDPEASVFEVGETKVALTDFDPLTFPYVSGIDPEGIPVELMSDHPALLPTGAIGGVIGGPKLHKWAEGHPKEVKATHEVMMEVYLAFLDEPLGELSEEDPSSPWGFRSVVGEDGGVELQVAGDCACLGPGLYGHQIRGRFEHGFAEYELHNADTQAQRTSLYAGIGHLSRLAA